MAEGTIPTAEKYWCRIPRGCHALRTVTCVGRVPLAVGILPRVVWRGRPPVRRDQPGSPLSYPPARVPEGSCGEKSPYNMM